jgi:CRP/FNR family transcriptional regulator, cyclic AMP receptor protein
MQTLTPLLLTFSPLELQILSACGESTTYAIGEKVLVQGEENHHLHLVLKGRLEVLANIDGRPQKFGELKTNDALGEVSMFDPGPASATVVAVQDTTLWRITREKLAQMHEQHPKVAYRLMERICVCLAKRLREMNDRVG